MIDRSELESAIKEATLPLEYALAFESLTQGFGEDLQLRYSYCGVATAALQRYLQERYEIATDRMIAMPAQAPRHINHRQMSHVVLRHESLVIDPTYSQFMSYVGVLPARVLDNEVLRALYPPRKIAVFPVATSNEFADSFTEAAHAADLAIQNSPREQVSFPPDDALRGASLDEKSAVYRAIWSPDGYKSFPVDEQPALRDYVIKVHDLMGEFADRI